MLKNIRGWEWLLIVITGLVILFHSSIIETIKETASSDGAGIERVKGKRGWFRNLIQAVVGELPGGNIVNTLWNIIWP